MKERKSIYILKLLNVSEIQDLRKFLESPYFNLKKEMTTFLEVALEYISQSEGKTLISNEEFWSKIYTTPYDDVKFRKLNSDFNHLVEEFLVQQTFTEDQQNRNVLKIKAITQRNGEELYESLRNDVVYGRRTDPNRNADYYLHTYMLEKQLFRLITDDERKKNFKDINMDRISENLDIYFITEKLKYYTDILSWNQIYNTSLNMRGIDIVIKLANNPLFREVPVIAIFLKIIQIKTSEQEDDLAYYELKQLINDHLHLFPKDEAKEIIDQSLNYTIKKVNQGKKAFEKESLDLYKQALDTEVLLTNGVLEVSDYRNISFIGLRVGDYKWVENFIKEFKDQLEEKDKWNAFYFSMARLETYKKNFNEVVENLNKIDFNDLWYYLNGKSLLIAAYYELKETDPLESLLQSFKTYVNREKLLIKSRKQKYLVFIKFTSRLLKLSKNDKTKLKKLKNEISEITGVINKPWLLEKINEMIK
jgi:hypothetical protein